MNEAHLIVGLGNPGAKYKGTRHNVGFLALDRLAKQWGGTWSEEKKFKARMSRVTLGHGNIHLCQPQTYMNLSLNPIIITNGPNGLAAQVHIRLRLA
jgi:peptidyl-tRNA hydrolase